MSIDAANLIRQAAVHLDEPTLTTDCEAQILTAIRHRQERGRHHRTALMAACGAIAVVMVLYMQFRSPSASSGHGAAGFTSNVEPVASPIAEPLPPVQEREPDVVQSIEEGSKDNEAVVAPEPVTRDAPVKDEAKGDAAKGDAAKGDATGDAAKSDEVKSDAAVERAIPDDLNPPADTDDAPPSVEALWGLVDHQRAGRHYSQAITTLEMLLGNYPNDSRAFLAAFTLARTLEAAGKDARRIALSYERAYDLAPTGPLARDSLKRALKTMQKTTRSDEVERLNNRWQNAFGEDDAAEGKGQSSP